MVDKTNASGLVEALNEQPIAEDSLAGYRGFLFFNGHVYLNPVRDLTLSRREWQGPFGVQNRSEWTVVRRPNNMYEIDNGNIFLTGYQGGAGMYTARFVVQIEPNWEIQTRDVSPDMVRAVLKQDDKTTKPLEIRLELSERWERNLQIPA